MEVVSINGGGGAVSFLRRTSIFPSITLSHKPPPASFLPLRLSSSSSSTPTLSSCACRATKKEKEKEKEKEKNSSSLQPVVKQHDDAFKEASEEEQEEVVAEEEFDIEAFNDEMLEGDFEEFEDDFEMEDIKPYVGDGGGGGGISLCGALWDKKALTIAKEVSMSFDDDLNIFAFKASSNQLIQVRIEKLSTKYGSPSMADIEAFTSAYRARLDEAVNEGTIPDNFSLVVSSPGVERAVRIPDDLERFKDKPMLVKYVVDDVEEASSRESEGIFRLISFDLDSGYCTWGVADVQINREKAGKGRPLSKKQREWQLKTPFKSLRLVRLYSEC